MKKISFVIAIIVPENQLDNNIIKMLQSLSKVPGGIIVLV